MLWQRQRQQQRWRHDDQMMHFIATSWSDKIKRITLEKTVCRHGRFYCCWMYAWYDTLSLHPKKEKQVVVCWAGSSRIIVKSLSLCVFMWSFNHFLKPRDQISFSFTVCIIFYFSWVCHGIFVMHFGVNLSETNVNFIHARTFSGSINR